MRLIGRACSVLMLAVTSVSFAQCGGRDDGGRSSASAESGSATSSQSPDASQASAGVTWIRVRTTTLRVNDTADAVFAVLKPADSRRKDVNPDPVNPNSLLVTHHYQVDGQSFSLTFARNPDPGPYRLAHISLTSFQQRTLATPSRTTAFCDEDKQTTAREVLSQLTTATVGEAILSADSRSGVKYTISESWWDTIQPKLRQTVTAVANADACLHGTARRLDFYRESGDRVAFADSSQGIVILED